MLKSKNTYYGYIFPDNDKTENYNPDIENTPLNKRIRWTNDEIQDLLIGVKRYGYGNWDKILNDDNLIFDESRTVKTLKAKYDNFCKDLPRKRSKKRKRSEDFKRQTKRRKIKKIKKRKTKETKEEKIIKSLDLFDKQTKILDSIEYTNEKKLYADSDIMYKFAERYKKTCLENLKNILSIFE